MTHHHIRNQRKYNL